MSQQPFTVAALRGAVDLSALKRPAAGAGGTGAAAAGAPGAPAGGADSDGLVVTGTDAGFQDVVNASMRVPSVVLLWSTRLPQSRDYLDVMTSVAQENQGRFQLVSVDVDANPGLLRAFQVQSVPMAIGLVQGQPAPLFVGALPREQVQPWIDELLKLAVQYGVTGRVTAVPDEPSPEPEPPVPVAHQAAFDAIERGDYDAAERAYQGALAEDPADELARVGLLQVHLLQRTSGVGRADAVAAATADPADVGPQLLIADLDVVAGHVNEGFGRLLDVVRKTAGEDRDRVRNHLLGLFEVVGPQDPRVVTARRALTSALF